jgi:lycopene beta-cyclase
MVYDYVIGGAGAAGMQLALAMATDTYFKNKSILIIEPEQQGDLNKRWCFWEEGDSKWQAWLDASWQHAAVRTNRYQFNLPLGNYRYNMLRADTFFAHAKETLKHYSNVHWCTDRIVAIDAQDSPVKITTEKGVYYAGHVFDSRVETPIGKAGREQINLLQHFRGWEVETETDCFTEGLIELMDFRHALPATCSFMYVLPFTARKALVEFTVFSAESYPDSVYDRCIENYLKPHRYSITHIEAGVIPMSTMPFHTMGNAFVTKIGTAGSWVKPSTGYSFSASGQKVKQVISNIKAGKAPDTQLIKSRFRYYDRLLLDILARNNALGPALFETLYRKNDISLLFRFLDEQTTFFEELLIMSRFNPLPFIKSIFRSMGAKLRRNV